MAMDFQAQLLLLVATLASMATMVAAHPTMGHEAVQYFGANHEVDGHGLPMDLDDDELLMEMDPTRRQLAASGGYISYAALMKNNVPCKIPGHSYYTCRNHQTVNPYRRGCTKATRCARNSR